MVEWWSRARLGVLEPHNFIKECKLLDLSKLFTEVTFLDDGLCQGCGEPEDGPPGEDPEIDGPCRGTHIKDGE